MHTMSTNFAKTLVWKHGNDVKFDVTNSAHQIQITTIWPWTKLPHENFLRTPLICYIASVFSFANLLLTRARRKVLRHRSFVKLLHVTKLLQWFAHVHSVQNSISKSTLLRLVCTNKF